MHTRAHQVGTQRQHIRSSRGCLLICHNPRNRGCYGTVSSQPNTGRLSDVSSFGSKQGRLLREGLLLIVTAKEWTMRKTSKSRGEKNVKDIERATRKHHSSEDKIKMLLDGLRCEECISELCHREYGAGTDEQRKCSGLQWKCRDHQCRKRRLCSSSRWRPADTSAGRGRRSGRQRFGRAER